MFFSANNTPNEIRPFTYFTQEFNNVAGTYTVPAGKLLTIHSISCVRNSGAGSEPDLTIQGRLFAKTSSTISAEKTYVDSNLIFPPFSLTTIALMDMIGSQYDQPASSTNGFVSTIQQLGNTSLGVSTSQRFWFKNMPFLAVLKAGETIVCNQNGSAGNFKIIGRLYDER